MNRSLLTDPHQRRLLKKWAPILESGKRIESDTTKIALAQLLENTHKYYKTTGQLNEAGMTTTDALGKAGLTTGKGVMTGLGTTKGDFYLPNVVMPMLRRIMPELIANDLVAVQPLNGPVGYALAYRPTYGTNGAFGQLNDQKWPKEIGYDPTDTRWTGTATAVSGDNAMWQAYAGNDAAKSAIWGGEGAETGAVEYAALGDNYPTVSFGLVKSAVEAKTRKLAAHWSPELAEDMQAMHGIDVEREMVNTLTYEVGAEIDRQIVTEMVKAAITGGSTSTWTPISADGIDQMGRLATLLTQITIEANQIAIRTRRGNANFVITTPRICALLQQLGMNKFTSLKNASTMPSVPDTGVGALTKVGFINDDQQLLIRDAYAATTGGDYILMGYKGKQAGDSGIIYCPYIPLQLSKVLQPLTFTPSIGCRTRYGVMSNPWDARNFYHFMKVELPSTPYTFATGERQFIAQPSAINLGGEFGPTTL